MKDTDLDNTKRSLGNLSSDAANAARGVFMGGANVVPGVSAGTVALVFGIYQRLIAAISHFDLKLLGHLRRREWRCAARHLDLRFLFWLGCGVVVGVVTTALLMSFLLADPQTRTLTLAAFLGMIFASGILVLRMIRVTSPTSLAQAIGLAVCGAAAAIGIFIAGLSRNAAADPGFVFLFACGALAMCAMMLPGISGAMVLLLLGVYDHVADVPKHLIHGEQIGSSLLAIAAVGGGCLLSLIMFSKVLRWLLIRHATPTMSVLCGFIFGSLPQLWPFQRKIARHETDYYWPPTIDGFVVSVAGIAIAAMVLVFALQRFGRAEAKGLSASSDDHSHCEKATG